MQTMLEDTMYLKQKDVIAPPVALSTLLFMSVPTAVLFHLPDVEVPVDIGTSHA